MKKIKYLSILLVFTASCYIGDNNDAFMWFTWTIDDYPASHTTCSNVDATSVVIEEDPYGEGHAMWRMVFPCLNGVARTTWHFESYVTTFVRFRLVNDDDEIISETSWEPFTPYPGENIYEVDFQTSSHPDGDAAIGLEWTINDRAATAATCGNAGADTVRVEHDVNGDQSSDMDYDFPCQNGEGTTDYLFYSGSYESIRFVLLGSEGIISATTWSIELFEQGVNLFSVNFNTPLPPPDNAALTFEWLIHFIPGDSEICQWAGADTVRLMMDDNDDGEEDRHFDFDCDSGSALTEDIFERGQVIYFAFALLDGSGDPISMTTGWASISLTGGENNLGSVNFIIGDYGPLGVELQWADAVGESAAYGDCDFPPQAVSKIGYLLSSEDGTIYDVVDIDEAPESCTDYLYWSIIDYGTYTLVVDGEDESGATSWGTECADLVVDDYELESNEFVCRIEMTESP